MLKTDEILAEEIVHDNENNINFLNKEIIDLKKEVESNKKKVTLILGAGVSQSVGFPSWKKLLAMAMGKVMTSLRLREDGTDNIKIQTLSRLHKEVVNGKPVTKFENGNNGYYEFAIESIDLLEIGEYIYNYFFERNSTVYDDEQLCLELTDKQMLSIIRSCFYKNKDKLNKLLDEKFNGSTLEVVTNIVCKLFDDKIIQKVITYNYDNLLEYCLKNRLSFPEEKINSVSHTDSNKSISNSQINICHIHGMFDITDLSVSSDNIILSESSYNKIENSNYLWLHTIQADAMLNDICVFVGFSATDHNFRRIIKNFEHKQGEKINNYFIFTIDSIVEAIFSKEIAKEKYKYIMESITDEEFNNKIKSIINNKSDSYENKLKTLLEYYDKKSSEVYSKYDELLKKVLSNENNTYERLMLHLIINSQTMYWEKNGIRPIWTTINELPLLLKSIFNIETL